MEKEGGGGAVERTQRVDVEVTKCGGGGGRDTAAASTGRHAAASVAGCREGRGGGVRGDADAEAAARPLEGGAARFCRRPGLGGTRTVAALAAPAGAAAHGREPILTDSAVSHVSRANDVL